ncbi:hypothetical protein [Halobacillus trueperi]|uniref:hypothetical protein n=1 Tax=Halobacillus trueperi TaxID=156205 RepID=UPI0037369F36
MDKIKIILIVLVAGLVIYAGTLHNKLNSYQQYVDWAEFTPASIMLDDNYVFYKLNSIIKESIEKEEMNSDTFQTLQNTYWNIRDHLETLTQMANQLEGENVNWNHIFEQISTVIYTLERMDKENNESGKLSEEQVDFLNDVLTLNDRMYKVFGEYKSISNKERKDIGRDYWVDYIKDIERETKGVVVKGIHR